MFFKDLQYNCAIFSTLFTQKGSHFLQQCEIYLTPRKVTISPSKIKRSTNNTQIKQYDLRVILENKKQPKNIAKTLQQTIKSLGDTRLFKYYLSYRAINDLHGEKGLT